MADAYAEPAGGVSTALATLSEENVKLNERLDKMEDLLVKIDQKPGAWPSFLTSKAFPAVMVSFSDYLGLALITPALPFYLQCYFEKQDDPATFAANYSGSNTCGNDPRIHDEVTSWSGYIVGVQFLCILASNMFWALFGHRVPSKLAVELTMLGDTACFAASAFISDPSLLIMIRALTGLSSPLVPGLVFILDRSASLPEIIQGVGQFTLAVILAYAAASAVVGFGWSAIGWQGINLIAAGFNGFAFLIVWFFGAPPNNPAPKAAPVGVFKALTTKFFALHAITHFTQGWMMGGMSLMYVLILKGLYNFGAETVAAIMLVLPVVLLVQNRLGTQFTIKYGINAVISGACVMAVVVQAAFVVLLDTEFDDGKLLPLFIVMMILTQAAVLFQMVPNGSRAAKIAALYAGPGANMAITGWGRVFFALGQGVGPIVVGALFHPHPWIAMICCLAVQCLELLLIVLCSGTIPMFTDRDPPKPVAILKEVALELDE